MRLRILNIVADGAMPDHVAHATVGKPHTIVAFLGERGILAGDELEPVRSVPALDELPAPPPDALARTVVIKLNGGLGTSMGLSAAKSLVRVKSETIVL